MVVGYPAQPLRDAFDTVARAEGLIVVTPVFSASYSGLFKLFFDVLDADVLAGKPVLIAATGGAARHALVLEHGMRPLFSHLRAVVAPTAVFAGPQDWGTPQRTRPPSPAVSSGRRVDWPARCGTGRFPRRANRPRTRPRSSSCSPAADTGPDAARPPPPGRRRSHIRWSPGLPGLCHAVGRSVMFSRVARSRWTVVPRVRSA